MVLGRYNLVLLGIKWYWVSIELLCLQILKKKVEIWSGVTIAGRQMNDEKGKLELLSHWTMEGRDEQLSTEEPNFTMYMTWEGLILLS